LPSPRGRWWILLSSTGRCTTIERSRV
jgi:hypothetical protein